MSQWGSGCLNQVKKRLKTPCYVWILTFFLHSFVISNAYQFFSDQLTIGGNDLLNQWGCAVRVKHFADVSVFGHSTTSVEIRQHEALEYLLFRIVGAGTEGSYFRERPNYIAVFIVS